MDVSYDVLAGIDNYILIYGPCTYAYNNRYIIVYTLYQNEIK